MHTKLSVAFAFLAASAAPPLLAQLPFFSGAEGYGGSFAGAPAPGVSAWFADAVIYRVTNLNDSGPGSLRAAFVENSANKIIVFDVAGTIQLTSDNLDIKNLSNYYIAGQTAPGPVTVYGDMAQLTHSSGKQNRNVILRYMSFRKGTGANSDSITFAGSGLGTNMILDHVSASWSEDEILSVANNNTNVTVQYSLIHDALVNNHAYGSLIRPRIDSNVTFHHNLYANNASRQARFGTYNGETLTADFRNNVVYNWRDRASYAGGSSEPEQESVDVNFVGNYFIAGPGTLSNTDKSFIVDKNVTLAAYQAGNRIDSDRQVNAGGQPNGQLYDGEAGWDQFAFTPIIDQTLEQRDTPFVTPNVTTQSANDAYWQLIDHVGNWWWGRDAIDNRVIDNVLTNTAPPIGAAAPLAGELNGLLTVPVVSHPAGWDTDSDGMPDSWELAHGLNPNSLPASPDWKLDFDNDGYINLIEYVNERGEFPAPAPIVFNGDTNNRYAQITNWNTQDGVTAGSNWQPARYDEAQINSGTVVVDAVGQHAGLLVLGANAGDNATLNVTAGWLQVADAVVIGGDDTATATLNLSGGLLTAPVLAKGGGGQLNFTGGILAAETIGFSLQNQGGVFAPGQSISDAHVMGDLTLTSGALQIELASDSDSDTVLVDGAAMLGGSLEVTLVGGFSPAEGDSWQILTAGGGITQMFSSITAGYTVQQQGNDLVLYFGAAPGTPGDFNGDGNVDAGDYVVWRATSGSQAEYEEWRSNFGVSAGAGGQARAAVPEAGSRLILGLGAALVTGCGLRKFGIFLQE
jgi:hypothetical protein